MVTGAGGYIGRCVVSTLSDVSADVIAADFRTDGIDSRAVVRYYDIADIYNELGCPDACVMKTTVDGIINYCTGNPVSLAEKVESFIKEHNFSIKLNYDVFFGAPLRFSRCLGQCGEDL